MKKSQKLTAAGLLAQLADDPQYQKKLAAQQRRVAEIEAAARPILADLEMAGFSVRSIDELLATHSPLPSEAVQILLRWLGRLTVPSLQDLIVRGLAYVEEPFDVRPLLALFEQTSSESLRCVIANTLAELRPLNVVEWVSQALNNREYGRAREMLPLALARIAPNNVANAILLEHLEEMPGHVALGLAESGCDAEKEAMKRKALSEKGWVRRELKRAVNRIEKRSSQRGDVR